MYRHIVATGVLMTLLSGCTPAQAGDDGSATTSPATAVTTTAVTTGSSPTRTTPTAAAPKTYDGDVQAALRTIVQYWQEQFAAHGRSFAPVATVTAYHGDNGPKCGNEKLDANNAAYCDGADFIGYDDIWIHTEWSAIGDTFVYYVLGHEYGHAVQSRLHITSSYTIKAELQADCLAGAYLGASIKDGRLGLQEGDLRELFDGVGSVADQPGVRWFASGAHGSAAERRTAFFGGYFGTVRACTTSL